MFRKLLLFAVLAGFAAFVLRFLYILDLNKRVYNHAPGPCRKLAGIVHGSEDIALVEELGLAFISSGVKYLKDRPSLKQGSVFLFDFNKFDEEPVKLKIEGLPENQQFFPHGMGHWVLSNDKIRLFTIVHGFPTIEHAIIVMDYNVLKRSLTFVKSLRDPKFVRPNGLRAVGPDSFIITNDGQAQTEFRMQIEGMFQQKTGSIVYFDGKESHYLLENLIAPNGLSLSRDGKYFYVTFPFEESIAVYGISSDFKELKFINKFSLLTMPDNLYVDPNGSVWTGAHPVVKDTFAHMSDPDDPAHHSPSQVLRIVFNDDHSSIEVTEPFTDDGRKISASSVAVSYGKYLLIGGVMREALLCEISHPSVL